MTDRLIMTLSDARKLLPFWTAASIAASALLLLLVGHPSLPLTCALTLVGVLILWQVHALLHARLTARIDGSAVGGNGTGHIRRDDWIVLLNGVELGSISDAHYAGIQRAALCDPRTAAAQLLNLSHVLAVGLDKALKLTPLCAFWLVLAAAAYAPESFTSFLHELREASPGALSGLATQFLDMLFRLAPLAAGALILLGGRLGFRDMYSEAINRRLRWHFETPAHGEISLVRHAVQFARKA